MSRRAGQLDASSNKVSPFEPVLPQKDEDMLWTGLAGDSLALAIAKAAGRHDGLLVVIAPDMQTADELRERLVFFACGNDLPVTCFPDWETLPYDTFSPHQDIISGRLATLYALPEMRRGMLVIPISTVMQRLPPRDYLYQNSLILNTGMALDLDAMRARLDASGYFCVSQVMEHGEFAIRGSLLDLFPMGSPLPFRIDLLDEEIETIKRFDPETQRSLGDESAVRLLPAREYPVNDKAIRHFRQQFRASFEGDPQGSPIYREVSEGNAPGGIEYYLPLFFEQLATLFDYLPKSTCIVKLDSVDEACEGFTQEYGERYAARCLDRERPVLVPEKLILGKDELAGHLRHYPIAAVEKLKRPKTAANAVRYGARLPGDLRVRPRHDMPAGNLQKFLDDFEGRVLITAESTGRRETLLEQLHGLDIHPAMVDGWSQFESTDSPLAITVAPLEEGAIIDFPAVAVVTETSLFGEHARQARSRKPARDMAGIIRDLTDLSIGAPVVHEFHGVGRYTGLETLAVNEIRSEYLAIEYSGGDKLYVPVASMELVSRYTGAAPENAPLHKLGGDQWQRARHKAGKRIHDIAAELLDIYARRAARKGYAYPGPQDEYAEFSAAFPFEETPDQETTISAVLDDMQKEMPMDRLVCGDVGFGKTEVAMRAAFLAANAGKQVAILVPTTLLAQQHFQTFSDRFANWPIRVEVLSRFQTVAQQETTLQGLADGSVDIVIGTHKLLQGGIDFKHLGLLIVDEEHRFGVKQKEKLKNLRSEVDILTLTATPIPRTLNMSLSGMRDLSIISTPPAHRLAVNTFVCEWDRATLREACLREIKRGGQIYFLHNEVGTIERIAGELAEIIPEAGTRIAHGQMRERDLEHVMLDFYHRRFNLLLCTTIIESGIDVPTANTIIINRADKLGLAQLHQLRGRVGRSHHRAYAYLIIPPRRSMTKDAIKRVEAVESMESIGAGFTLATHDLEIRGAGELLGDEQSGQIHEIGFSLYTDLLERAVTALKEGRQPELGKPLHQGPEIDLLLPALIPDEYIPDVHMRLVLYKRIAGAASPQDLRELQIEMIDRFGLLPDPVKNLFRIAELKLAAEPLGIRKIELGRKEGRIVFGENPDIDTQSIIDLIQGDPQNFRMAGADSLRFTGNYDEESERFSAISDIIRKFGKPATAANASPGGQDIHD